MRVTPFHSATSASLTSAALRRARIGATSRRTDERVEPAAAPEATASRRPAPIPANRALVMVPPFASVSESLHATRAYRATAEGPHPFPAGSMLRIAV